MTTDTRHGRPTRRAALRIGAAFAGLLFGGCAAHRAPDPARVTEAIVKRGVLPAGVSLSDGLTEDEAVTLALARNPDFQADLADLLFAGASLQEAGQFRNPVLTLLFPWGPKQLEATAKWPFDALWLRPRRVAAARLDADAVVERLVARGLSLAADARIAYADATSARQRAATVSEAARVRERIGEIAEARLRAGDVSAFEIGATRADAALAGEERARALAEAQAAGDRLRALLGLGDEPLDFSPAPVATGGCPDLTTLLRDGALRPDIRSAELTLEAARKRAGLARWEVFGLTAVADANQRGTKGFEMGPGLETALPLLHWNGAAATRERAEVERARARYVAVQHHAAADVRAAHTRHEEAREVLRKWRDEVRPLREEELRQAHVLYDAGEQPYLIVLEAERRRLEARTREADAEAELRRASARLESSVGARLACAAAGP